MASINSLLKQKADDYFISYGSPEREKINASLTNLKNKLLGNPNLTIRSIDEFGSFKRGTILPRTYDSSSDVDLLIIFDFANSNVRPINYRNKLREFAQTYYPRSESYKDAPTVVLELDHIKYDLVPCYVERYYYLGDQYHIPKSDTEWMQSDIYNFNNKLTEVNTSYNYIVKPIIRLFKAWNAKVGYPIESYILEQEIASINFRGDNYETGFLYAIGQLNTYQRSINSTSKIEALKSNANKIREYLASDQQYMAEAWLRHILPF